MKNSNNRLTTKDVYDLIDKKVGKLESNINERFDQLENNHIKTLYKKQDWIMRWLVLVLGGLAVNLFLLLVIK